MPEPPQPQSVSALGGTLTPLPAAEVNNTVLLRRLLGLAWRYRRQCLAVFGYQVLLLALGVAGLALSGLGIDVTRHALQPSAAAPRWPLGISPPGWRDLHQLALI